MNRMRIVWPALAAILATGAVGIAQAQMPSGGPPGWNAAMTKLFGCIVALDKKAMQIIFPSLAAYVETPLPEDEVAALDKGLKLQKTPLGKETIDGHPCVMNRVVMTDAKGQVAEAVVWNATDLKGFPVQMQMNEKETTVIMRYNEIHLGKPDAKQFDPPAGYTKHADMQQLMIAIAQKQSPKGGPNGRQ